MSVHSESDGSVPSVSPAVLHERLLAGEAVTILDVRDRDEFESWHVDGPSVTARQIPHVKFVQAEVKGTAADLVADVAEPIIAVCGEGEASRHAAGLLVDAGVDAYNLAGGMDAWAELLVARELDDVPGTVIQYDRPASGCLSYLVVVGDEAVVVDPLRAFTHRYIEDANERGADIRYAVDTHVHADHVSGVRAVAAESDAEPVLPELARERGLAFDVRPVADGEALSVGNAQLKAIHTPGHTSEMTAFEYDGVLFAGDGLFLDSVARPDLEDGDEGAPDAARQLYHTLQEKVLTYPDSVRLAPAHYGPNSPRADDGTYTATIGEVRDRLDALSLREDDFVEFVLADMPPQPANYERIIDANLGRESLSDADAFEVELGPNNCAATR
ncbi:MBL fold metallo-hydrolase [Haloarchaeobius sp. DFWS5]|uniref:MBL fold metallo-hydrolase n=1 Tax=Haloarchaeobius sp. DFWS5 TaxID=3446114 RepID=UPI003EB79BB5